MSNSDRTLEILFRMLRGEEISVRKLADEHGISTKSVSRDIGRIKDFLAENRDLTGNAELFHYSEVKHYCDDVTENLWKLVNIIHDNREITISYYKIDKTYAEKRIQPVSFIFMEYYFYLIAFYPNKFDEPRYFRIDRITDIVEHRQTFDTTKIPDFDEGMLRQRCQFMFYGKLRKIRFEYTGPSLQAILDRIPTAQIIEKKQNFHTIEAEAHGDGIIMFLLSQGAWVKVISPADFAQEIKREIENMSKLYE